MKFEILSRDKKLADVELNPNGKLGTIKVQQYVDGFIRQFQKRDEDITSKDFHKWLVWRTFPPSRANKKEILADMGYKNTLDLLLLKKHTR